MKIYCYLADRQVAKAPQGVIVYEYVRADILDQHSLNTQTVCDKNNLPQIIQHIPR